MWMVGGKCLSWFPASFGGKRRLRSSSPTSATSTGAAGHRPTPSLFPAPSPARSVAGALVGPRGKPVLTQFMASARPSAVPLATGELCSARQLLGCSLRCREKRDMAEHKRQPCSLGAGPSLPSAPRRSILAVVGERVLLPCHVAAEHLTEVFSVRWLFHEQPQPITVSQYDGKDEEEPHGECYRDRAAFFHRDLRAGNVSLRLENVRSSDRGSYTCAVALNGTCHDTVVELEVAGQW